MPKLTENEHPLEYPYVYSYFKRPPGNFNPENYVKHVRPVGTFSTVEQFWRLYTHLQRPGEAVDKVDFHVFKRGIKPVWEVKYIELIKIISFFEKIKISLFFCLG